MAKIPPADTPIIDRASGRMSLEWFTAFQRIASELGAAASGGVASFEGRSGIVTSAGGDYTASEITNVPSGNIAATDVQAALNEIDSEKYNSGDSPSFANETLTGYLDLGEIAAPASPAANMARLYAVDSSGTTKVEAKDSGGTAHDLTHFTQAGTGASLRTQQAKLREVVSVIDFGAVGNSNGAAGNGTDDKAAFQAALDYGLATGAEIYIPRGRYRISGALGLDYTTGADFSTLRSSIRGDGARASLLIFDDGDFAGLTLAGPTTPWPSGQTFQGFGLIKEDGQGEGLLLGRMAHIHVKDVEVVAWETGLVGIDVQESLFSNFTAYFNLYGGYFERSSVTQPNVLTFICCTFANSQNQGLDIVDPGQLCFYGGSIESNGELGSDTDKFGLRLRWETTTAEANIGCSLNGVYFERNAGVGDIHLINDQIPLAWNINGCNFNRAEVGTGTGLFGTSCVTISGGGSVKNTLALMGNGFGGLPRTGGGAYVPNAARPYITISSPSEPLTILDAGNQYADALETPVWNSDGGVSVAQTASQAVGNVLYSNAADGAGGPGLRFISDSVSPAANDYGGAILSEFRDSAGNLFVGCEIDAKLLDPTNGSEDTALEFYTTVAGSPTLAAGLANGLTVGTATYDGTGSIRAAGSIKSQGAGGGVGYAPGAGGAVTQGVSKSTAVTIDRPCGQITMHNAQLNAGASVTFTVNNSTVATTDCVVVNHDSVGSLGVYDINAHTIGAGSFAITVSNYSAGNLSQAIVLNFAIIKCVAS